MAIDTAPHNAPFRGYEDPPEEHQAFIKALVKEGYTYSGDTLGWCINSKNGIRMVSAGLKSVLGKTWVIKCYAQSISTMALLHGIQVTDMVSVNKANFEEMKNEAAKPSN